ncbi:MAG TPA: hypothetical protein VE783_00430 [Candidatus Limnocylindrales bacterium]|nr:hypothetical protein [Candidatus Limnocylindrales bacterium]
MLVNNTQFGKSSLWRWTAFTCILLVVLMTGVESVHAHSGVADGRASSSCAICISAHANAPVVSYHPLPTLAAVAMVAVPFQSQGKGISAELSLFIRPPPAA